MVGSVAPFLAFVASHRLHCSGTLISLMLASPWVGSTLCLVWANAMEGRSTMRFVTITWIVARGLILLMAFAVTPYMFAAVAIGYQFINMICIPGYTSIMKAIYPDDHRGKLMGYVRMAMTIVATVTTLAVGPILKHWDWSYRVVFPIGAVFGMASALIFYRIKIPGDDEESLSQTQRVPFADTVRSVVSVLRHDKRFAWFMFATTVYGFGNFFAIPAYPKFMDEVLKMDEWTLAIYSVLASIALMLGYMFWGHYIDRKSPVRCTAITIFINAGLPLVCLLSTSVAHLVPGPPAYVWVFPAAVMAGAVQAGLELSYFSAVLHFAPPGQEMVYQSVQSGIQGLRGIAGPIMGGIMYDVLKQGHHDVRYVFLVSFVLILVGWALLAYGRKDLRTSD